MEERPVVKEETQKIKHEYNIDDLADVLNDWNPNVEPRGHKRAHKDLCKEDKGI